MESDVLLTPEEQLKVFSDALISSVIQGDDLSRKNRQILYGQITPRIFKEENFILYSVLYNFKEQKLTPDSSFYKMYLLRNEAVILNAKDNISIASYADLDENPVVGYVTGVLKQYEYLKTLPILSEDEFRLTLEKYKLEFKNAEMGAYLGKARVILYDGLQVGRKYYQGYEDSLAYVKRGMAEIDSLVSTTSGSGFIDASERGMADDENSQIEKIGDFGQLRELNEIFGGIYTKMFYSILAPTKGGKSKFTTRMIHNIVVEHGNNVVVWAHEGGPDMWLAQMRAIHFDYVYNKDETDVTRMQVGISQKTILTNSFQSDAVKELETASRVDLFTNPSYGKIIIIDRPFCVETFIDEIETAVQLNNAKAVMIDYLQLIGSNSSSSNSKKSENIGKAYQLLLAYIKTRGIAAISPAQFTQDFIKESSKSKSMKGMETRVAGGESSEIVRTPDVNIGLYASPEDLENHRMQIVSVPSRLSVVYSPIDIYCDLGTCMFSSLEGEDSSSS